MSGSASTYRVTFGLFILNSSQDSNESLPRLLATGSRTYRGDPPPGKASMFYLPVGNSAEAREFPGSLNATEGPSGTLALLYVTDKVTTFGDRLRSLFRSSSGERTASVVGTPMAGRGSRRSCECGQRSISTDGVVSAVEAPPDQQEHSQTEEEG